MSARPYGDLVEFLLERASGADLLDLVAAALTEVEARDAGIQGHPDEPGTILLTGWGNVERDPVVPTWIRAVYHCDEALLAAANADRSR